MRQDDLFTLKERFTSYVAGFLDMDAEGVRNIRLKEEHTLRVAELIEKLVEGEGLPEQERLVAAACAFCHDLGRFPQYRRWRTFRDSDSDNHARLSVEVIREECLLKQLTAEEQMMIEEAVRFHNLLTLPESYASPHDRFIRLLRDADKLDIWRVFLEYYRLPEQERASAVGLGFPDLPEVTPACLLALAEGRIVKLEEARVLNDFKLLQISWAYDLNFTTSYRLLLEKGYLDLLAATLPDIPAIHAAVAVALNRTRQKACTDRRDHALC